MSSANEQPEKRNVAFEEFFSLLIPTLVDFIEKIGIKPSHFVLKQAVAYTPHVDEALMNMAVVSPDDRNWLITRMGYFIGEYFAQKYGGCWYVNSIENSRLEGM